MSQRAGWPRLLFVDTSGYGAIANDRDGDHRKALAIRESFNRAAYRVCTSNFVLAETHALLLRRIGTKRALAEIQSLMSGATMIVRIAEEDENRAIDILTHYTDKDFSYTDATSFAVMERLGIEAAFTFDHHFGQYGFQPLTADPG